MLQPRSLAVCGSYLVRFHAKLCATKIVEAAGIFAIGEDLEEEWHVQRFAYPINMPVLVIAPTGRSYWRARNLATTARALERRVIAATHKDDTEVTRHAYAVLPVQGEIREEFSPWLYHLFANYVASYVAARLGRSLFQGDRPELLQSWTSTTPAGNKMRRIQIERAVEDGLGPARGVRAWHYVVTSISRR